jgi:hypothetical protein
MFSRVTQNHTMGVVKCNLLANPGVTQLDILNLFQWAINSFQLWQS